VGNTKTDLDHTHKPKNLPDDLERMAGKDQTIIKPQGFTIIAIAEGSRSRCYANTP